MKILIIRFSSIGDIILTTPIIRCLKEQLKGVEIHFLTKGSYVSLLEHNPNINRVIGVENDVSECISDLKKEAYDQIVDLHKNIRSKSVARQLAVMRYSFSKENINKFLLTKFKWDKMPDVHIVDRYFQAVKHLGINNDGKGLDVFFDSNVEKIHEDFFKKPFIAFAIGAQHFTKRLPKEKIVEICEGLSHPIVLLGGVSDVQAGDYIVDHCSKASVISLCGKYSLLASARILKEAKLLITHDTGLMHIGAAFKMPIVSIWGNTVPAFGMYPYMPNHEAKYQIIEQKELSCRPCSKIGYQQCPKKHFRCMEEHSEKEIVLQVNRMLN